MSDKIKIWLQWGNEYDYLGHDIWHKKQVILPMQRLNNKYAFDVANTIYCN